MLGLLELIVGLLDGKLEDPEDKETTLVGRGLTRRGE